MTDMELKLRTTAELTTIYDAKRKEKAELKQHPERFKDVFKTAAATSGYPLPEKEDLFFELSLKSFVNDIMVLHETEIWKQLDSDIFEIGLELLNRGESVG